MRGIPSAYYGTEILMKGFSNPDGLVRSDFPGGWTSDSQNKFIVVGRSDQENESYNYFRTLALWRKKTPEAQNGKLIQFVPEESIYTYFRFSDSKSIMVIMNCNDKQMDFKMTRYAERIGKHSTAKDVENGKDVPLADMKLEPWEVKVLEF